MSLIDGNSRFSKSAVKDIRRSIFDRDNTLLTSFSAGKLVPIYVDEVLPGDTVTMDMSLLCRMATPLYPVMDSAWIDVHWFFVPNRLVWENWKYFMGETRDAWEDNVEYEVPFDRLVVKDGSFYDYAGLPNSPFNGTNPIYTVNALPRRAYELVWNEWYRDQNLQDSILIDVGDTAKSDISVAESAVNVFGLLPVNKYKDYFTSALPEPARPSDVLIPNSNSISPLTVGSPYSIGPIKMFTGDNLLYGPYTLGLFDSDLGTLAIDPSPSEPISFLNLYSSSGDGATINQLRQAFAVQRLLENDARGGTRYRELVKAHFGVDIGDARVQVPEYLGGAHIPINVQQVVQQSSTASEPSPLGETGAMSKTVHSDSMFTKSFVEHGILLGLASVRTQHSYQQGIHKMWKRKDRFDFYWPELANIGEQPIKNYEIYAQGEVSGAGVDDEIFGYQEAYAEYRYRQNIITGNMRQKSDTITSDGSLAVWHYGDYYSELPKLSDEWVRETDENIARTLAVSDTSVFDQFLCDIYFRARWARPMPLYSIPGLSGHF